MNDIVKFVAVIVIAVLALTLAIKLFVGFFFGLIIPLALIAGVAGVAYYFVRARGEKKG